MSMQTSLPSSGDNLCSVTLVLLEEVYNLCDLEILGYKKHCNVSILCIEKLQNEIDEA
jgi:hypothetical protein